LGNNAVVRGKARYDCTFVVQMYLDTVVLMYQLILYYSFDLLFIRILPTNLFIHCRLLQTFKTLGLLDYIFYRGNTNVQIISHWSVGNDV
jgi:hypothetical protein